MKYDIVTISDVYVYVNTNHALLVGFDLEEPDDSEEKFWIPCSQIEDRDVYEVGDFGYISIPEWLAEEKGLDAFI